MCLGILVILSIPCTLSRPWYACRKLWFCHIDEIEITFLLAVAKRTGRGCSRHLWKNATSTRGLQLFLHNTIALDTNGDRRQQPRTAHCWTASSSLIGWVSVLFRLTPRPQGKGFGVGGFRTCPVYSTCKTCWKGSKVFTIIRTWHLGTGVLVFTGIQRSGSQHTSTFCSEYSAAC